MLSIQRDKRIMVSLKKNMKKETWQLQWWS